MARPTHTSNFGKLADELRIAIDEDSKAALGALAFAAGKPLSEYIRDLLHIHVHGHAAVLRARMKGPE